MAKCDQSRITTLTIADPQDFPTLWRKLCLTVTRRWRARSSREGYSLLSDDDIDQRSLPAFISRLASEVNLGHQVSACRGEWQFHDPSPRAVQEYVDEGLVPTSSSRASSQVCPAAVVPRRASVLGHLSRARSSLRSCIGTALQWATGQRLGAVILGQLMAAKRCRPAEFQKKHGVKIKINKLRRR